MKNLKQLGVSLEELYIAENKQINVHLSDKPYVFSLILKGRDNEPDCKLSSFGANLYVRSKNGMNRQKYSSLANLQTAIKKLIANNVETNGEVTFSVSDEVYTF